MSLYVNVKTMATHTTRLHRNDFITGLPIYMQICSNCVYYERSFPINFEHLPNRPNIGTTHCRLIKRSESYMRVLHVFQLWMSHKSTACIAASHIYAIDHKMSHRRIWANACIPTHRCLLVGDDTHTINSQIFTIKMSYAIYWLYCFPN